MTKVKFRTIICSNKDVFILRDTMTRFNISNSRINPLIIHIVARVLHFTKNKNVMFFSSQFYTKFFYTSVTMKSWYIKGLISLWHLHRNHVTSNTEENRLGRFAFEAQQQNHRLLGSLEPKQKQIVFIIVEGYWCLMHTQRSEKSKSVGKLDGWGSINIDISIYDLAMRQRGFFFLSFSTIFIRLSV